MLSKIIGGSLLIIGTSVGAGMLALPVATAAGGYLNSVWLFVSAWLVTVVAAFFILEVNLWLPPHSNLVSMAKHTLGTFGEVITWFCYLLLLYSLLAAYTSGGADLLRTVFELVSFNTAPWFDAVLFVLILGGIVYFGIHMVDMANRAFMFVKLAAYAMLVALIIPHVKAENLMGGNYHELKSALMVVITSFGYATIIPSLRAYFNDNVRALRITIALGSLVSLVCYLLWDFAVQGAVSATGAKGLINMATSGRTTSDLTHALNSQINQQLKNVADLFTSVCMTTAFLGVGLCLSDFLADGLPRVRHYGQWAIALLAFLPPLVVVLFYPDAFIIGLKYAGVFCVVLLILLPALMVGSGRYVKKIATGYRVWGGRPLVAIECLLALLLLGYGVMHL